jgi:hypothetical protein
VSSKAFGNDIQELLPRIRERREEIERGRRLPVDLVDQLVATGVFRLAIPRGLGGEELDPVDQIRVIQLEACALLERQRPFGEDNDEFGAHGRNDETALDRSSRSSRRRYPTCSIRNWYSSSESEARSIAEPPLPIQTTPPRDAR